MSDTANAAPDVIWLGGWLCYPAHFGGPGNPPVDTCARLFEVLANKWSVNVMKEDPLVTFEEDMAGRSYTLGDIEAYVESLFIPTDGQAAGEIATNTYEDFLGEKNQYLFVRPSPLPNIVVKVFRLSLPLDDVEIVRATRATIENLKILGHHIF